MSFCGCHELPPNKIKQLMRSRLFPATTPLPNNPYAAFLRVERLTVRVSDDDPESEDNDFDDSEPLNTAFTSAITPLGRLPVPPCHRMPF
ncbi:hypothetical protein B0H14DRAFT_3518755 [Mycena olivaceomarginata]|nr:hypothetical protein B0H14DRAFT_3518755 [Mycena olivaceomarginata]